MLFKSIVPPCELGTILLPLRRTRVLVEPNPLKLTVAVPEPGLFELLSEPGTICGNWFKSDSILIVLVTLI